ncbi:methyltransferase domain-containing protein [Agrilactobacillus yilanensis]|uniref:Methyltransferase domain-containing protein n=1 Tax=Agrilactobacillus yilanensis TaxID=2485997 RepID=A0ABW4JA07_9LACO|nr:methyltransferase domain-containing protein [Agrilactobacillus yilanensis]
MKKSQVIARYLQTQLNLLKCPICQSDFSSIQGITLTCVHGHSFDISKKGSVFFLNAPVKTEYTTEMLIKRQKIIQAGLFQPVLARISTLLKGDRIIDAGCGEGSQIKTIAQAHAANYFAFDISKPAINLAVSGADFAEKVAFFVGDLAHMPFKDHQFTDIVNILSPANYSEFKRVLAPGGQLIKVMPNAAYLQELRQLVYPTGANATYDPEPVQAHFLQQFPDSVLEQMHYTFDLTPDLAQALFAMTPLTWMATAGAAADVTSLQRITVDLTIAIAEI